MSITIPRRAGRSAACLLLVAVLAAAPALADPFISGTVVAEPNTGDPGLGSWVYRVILSWDTDVSYALSHMDIMMDYEDGNCDCGVFAEHISFDDPAGFAMGDPHPCVFLFYAEFLCAGDPSIDVPGHMLKFEPYEDPDCEPSTTGVGTFTFYSDLAPAPIAAPNLFLVDKFGQMISWGELTGSWPGFACDPVAERQASWGAIKRTYGR